MRAGLYQDKGEKDKAMADVDQALKLRPELPAAIRTRALLLAQSQRFDEAIGEIGKTPQTRSQRPADVDATGHGLQHPEENGQGHRNLYGAAWPKIPTSGKPCGHAATPI